MNVYDELNKIFKDSYESEDNVAYGRMMLFNEEDEKEFCFVFKNNKEFKESFKTIKEDKFEYDNGFGCQFLYGTIVFKDNSWISREEYDGSEWWEYYKTPSREQI